MRQDHLMILTDAGATLHLGWDYKIPYSIDPLNGVDVDLKLAQGVNQIGTTVEGQDVAGVYRTITGYFWGGDQDAELFLRAIPYHTNGTLYLADKYFTRFVISKTPYISQYDPFPKFTMMIYCAKPYWYSLEAQSYLLGGYRAAFHFPVCYTKHCYSTTLQDAFTNVLNPGALPVPFTCILTCRRSVQNPRVVNAVTGAHIGLADTVMQSGDVIEIYRTTSDRLAIKRTRDGVEENIFSLLDEDSSLTELAPGDNLLKLDADSGAEALQASIQFYPMEAGVLPERL